MKGKQFNPKPGEAFVVVRCDCGFGRIVRSIEEAEALKEYHFAGGTSAARRAAHARGITGWAVKEGTAHDRPGLSLHRTGEGLTVRSITRKDGTTNIKDAWCSWCDGMRPPTGDRARGFLRASPYGGVRRELTADDVVRWWTQHAATKRHAVAVGNHRIAERIANALR